MSSTTTSPPLSSTLSPMSSPELPNITTRNRGILKLSNECLERLCLHMSEVYEPTGEVIADHKRLLSLAMTCRALFDPAMSTMWCLMYTLVPLFHTLPDDLCIREQVTVLRPLEGAEKNIQETRTQLAFARMPTPKDFVRWKKYAAFIKYLFIHDDNRFCPYSSSLPTISRSALASLATYGPRPLVSCLEALRFQDYQLNGCPGYTIRFFTETLTSLRLTVRNPRVNFITYLGALSRFAPKLTFLSLEHDPKVWTQQTAYTCYTDSIRGLGLSELVHLRKLSFINIYCTFGALGELAGLPHLEELTLSFGDSYGYPKSRVFPSLKVLHIVTEVFSAVPDVISIVQSSSIHTLSVECAKSKFSKEPRHVPNADIEALFSALATHRSCDTLKRLTISISPQQSPRDLSAAIRPLLALSNLAILEMWGWAAITVDDETLDAMSRAWPHLECLDVCRPGVFQFTVPQDEVDDGDDEEVNEQKEVALGLRWVAGLKRLSSDQAMPEYEVTFETFDEEKDGKTTRVKVGMVTMKPRATLRGLVPLGLRCPLLHTIHLSIDTAVKDVQSPAPAPLPFVPSANFGLDPTMMRENGHFNGFGPSMVCNAHISPPQRDNKESELPRMLPENSALTRLYVGAYAPPPSAPSQIAAVLSAVFPHLEWIDFGLHPERNSEADMQGWRRVCAVLKHFRIIRAQERRRAGQNARAVATAGPLAPG